jgi:hypothetical protein
LEEKEVNNTIHSRLMTSATKERNLLK